MAANENNTNGGKNGKKKKITAIAVSAVALCIAVAIVLLLLLRPGEDPGGIVTSGGSGVNGGDIPPGVEDPEEPELPDRPADEDYEEPVEPETPITPGTVMEAGDRPTLRELLLYDAELTIRLTADVETGSPFTVQGKKTLIGDHSVTYFMDGVPNTYVFTLAADSALTFDGPTVNGNNRASGFFADEGSNLTYLSGSVININAYAVNTFKSEVRIKGGTFDDSGMGTIGISAQSQGYIEGGTFSAGEDATAVAMNGSYLRITGNPVFKRNWGVGNTAMFGAYADSEIDVRGGDYDGGNIASNIFYVNASKLTIKGTESSPIEIYNSGYDGVRAGADGEYNLEYVYFHDIAVAAMRTNDKAKTDVSHCRVENADYGYLVYGVGTVGSVSDVDFENIELYAVVSYGNGSRVTVSDCTVDKAYRAVYITATSFVKNPDGSFDVDRNEIDVRNITCTEVRNPFHAIKRGKLTVHNAKVSGVTEIPCFISEDSEFYCYDSEFFDNHTPGNGGVVWAAAEKVVLSGCTFRDGVCGSDLGGGAIYVKGKTETTVTDCTFRNLTSGNQGGAIYINENARVTTENCTFENTASATSSGGAVYVNTNATYQDGVAGKKDSGSTFTNCRSGTVAGAIKINGKVNLYGSTFTYNTATTGGAIYVEQNTGDVRIEDVTFDRNTGTSGPSAITVLNGSTVRMENAVFTNNTANGAGGVCTTLLVQGAKVTGRNCVFTGNVGGTGAYGGAIIVTSANSKLTLTSDDKTKYKFEGNYTTVANSKGADICVLDAGNADISGYTFSDGKESPCGAAAFNNAGILKISDCDFRDHTVTGNGGVIWCRGGTITAEKCDFTGNSAGGNGGVLYIKSAASMKATDCRVFGNTANIQGGVFYIDHTADDNTNNLGFASVTTEKCTFGGDAAELGNSAVSGGAILTRGGTVKLTGGTVRNNQAVGVGNGGALWADGGAEITIDGTDFIENKANTTDGNLGGGAMYIIGGAQLTAANCEFTGNSVVKAKAEGAVNGGGVLYIKETGTAASFDNCTFKKNTSAHWGGVFYIQDAAAVTTKNCTFGGDAEELGNSAAAAGGAVYVIKGATYTDGTAGGAADGSTFKFNHSDDAGSAIKASTTVNLYGTAFASNSSKNTGGAVLVDAETAMKADDCTFTGNTSGQGGAINIQGTASVTTERCTFGGETDADGNSATGSGGAIYVNNGASYQDGIAGDKTAGSAFQFNNAANGGAIKVNGKIYIYGSTFRSNFATDGGAVFMEWGKDAVVELKDAAFVGNTSTGSAGALHLKKSATPVTITGTAFTGNTGGGHGGAVFIEGVAVNVNECDFEGNTAKGNGGALAVNNDTGTVTVHLYGKTDGGNSVIGGNTAAKGGSVAVFGTNGNASSTVDIKNYTFTGNKGTEGYAEGFMEKGTATTDGTVSGWKQDQ